MRNEFLKNAGPAATAALLASVLAAAPALAVGCPAGKSGVDLRAPAPNPASGVTDNVVGSIDVAKEPAHVEGRLLRMRKLVIQPGGVAPWHSHHDRPAIIVITKGTTSSIDRPKTAHKMSDNRPISSRAGRDS